MSRQPGQSLRSLIFFRNHTYGRHRKAGTGSSPGRNARLLPLPGRDVRDDAGRHLLPRVLLVGLTSGFDPSGCSTVPNYLLGMLAHKFPGRVEQCGLFAPGLMDRAALAHVKTWPGTREAVALKDQIDLIVSGLGSTADEGSVFWKFVRDKLGGRDRPDPAKRAVGDMLFGPFNAFGEPVDLGLEMGMTAIVDLTELRRFVADGRPRVVAAVGRRGTDRPTQAETLLAALRGEFFDTLIVDVSTVNGG